MSMCPIKQSITLWAAFLLTPYKFMTIAFSLYSSIFFNVLSLKLSNNSHAKYPFCFLSMQLWLSVWLTHIQNMCLKISTTSGEAGWFSHSLLLFMPIIINFPFFFFSYWLKAMGHHLHLTKATYPLVLCYSYLYSLNLHDIELFLYSPDKCHYSLNILLLLFTC